MLKRHANYNKLQREAQQARVTYLDVEELFSQHGRSVIDGLTGTIELAAQHFSGDWHSEHITGELAMGVLIVDVSSAFEDLRTLGFVCLPGRQRAFHRFRGLDLCAVGRLQDEH